MKVTWRWLSHKGTTGIRCSQPLGHDRGNAEATLIRVGLTENTAVRPHLYTLSFSRIDGESPDSIFVGRQPRVLRMAFDSVAGRPREHQKMLIR